MDVRRRWGWLLAGAILIGGGLWVRLDRLAAPSFDIDEYLHVFAAQSLNTTGSPALPSGMVYGRGLPYTRLVALSFKLTGAVNEFTARLPSVALDLAVFSVVFLMVRGWLGAPAAFAAALLLVFSPWWIVEAKNCRMYTLLNFVHISMAWCAWQALEGRGLPRLLWAAFAAALVLFGTQVHRLSMNLLPALGVFVLLQAAVTRRRFYAVLAVAGILGAAAAVFGGFVDLGKLWRQANESPSWAAASRYDWSYYLRRWWETYPALILLYPLAIARIWRRKPAVALFLLCAGLVPFGLHSVVYDWKRLRYSLYLLPWLVIPVGALCAGWLTQWWNSRTAKLRAAAAALIAALLFPWAGRVAGTPQQFPSPAWRDAYAWLHPQLKGDDAVLSSMPLATLYYLRRPASYVMNNVHIKEGASDARRGGDGFYRDNYSGQPMVTSRQELEQVVGRHSRGWILIDALRFSGNTTLTAETRDYITTTMQRKELPAPALGRPVEVYQWQR